MILTYHEILPHPSSYRYGVAASCLEEHLMFLYQQGGAARCGDRSIVVTFDDGHVSNYDLALPLLTKHNCKACFFVTAGWAGARQNYMDWRQLKELAALGHEIQSHGWSHKFLTDCTARELEEELRRSKQMLEDQLGTAVNAIAAPGGRWNAAVVSACAAAGYQRLYLSDPWLSPQTRQDVDLVGRLMVTRGMAVPDLKKVIEMHGAGLLMARAKHQAKERVRTLLGDRTYHRLWCALAGGQR